MYACNVVLECYDAVATTTIGNMCIRDEVSPDYMHNCTYIDFDEHTIIFVAVMAVNSPHSCHPVGQISSTCSKRTYCQPGMDGKRKEVLSEQAIIVHHFDNFSLFD